MKRPEARRVLVVIAMFAFAVMYASYCSTSCALEGLPEVSQHSESHDSSPNQSHDDGSGDSGCAAADHFGAYVPTLVGMARVELTSVGRVHVTVPGMLQLGTPSSIMSSFGLSGLAPPPKLKGSVYYQISVLRI